MPTHVLLILYNEVKSNWVSVCGRSSMTPCLPLTAQHVSGAWSGFSTEHLYRGDEAGGSNGAAPAPFASLPRSHIGFDAPPAHAQPVNFTGFPSVSTAAFSLSPHPGVHVHGDGGRAHA